MRRLQDLPGQELFRYFDHSGVIRDVSSHDVNAYLREITDQGFTAKDFRTWMASVVTAESLVAVGAYSSATGLKLNLNLAIAEAATRLGNSKTVCRNSYVHPDVIGAYEEGWLRSTWKATHLEDPPDGIEREEAALLAVLNHAESSRGGELAQAV